MRCEGIVKHRPFEITFILLNRNKFHEIGVEETEGVPSIKNSMHICNYGMKLTNNPKKKMRLKIMKIDNEIEEVEVEEVYLNDPKHPSNRNKSQNRDQRTSSGSRPLTEESGQGYSSPQEDLIDMLMNDAKPELHQAMHFDRVLQTLFLGFDTTSGTFLISSKAKLIAVETAMHTYNVVGIPSGQITPVLVKSFLKDVPVDPREIYNELVNFIRRFVVLPVEGYVDVLALSVILTYCYQIFTHVPYLWLAAEKNSGKTTLLNLLSLLSFNSMQTAGSSAASLFRSVEARRVSICMDEVDKLSKVNSGTNQTMEILLSGYRYDGIIYRAEHDKESKKWVPRPYSTYSPKFFASTKPITPVLASRCIKIDMLRKKQSEKTERFKPTPDLEKEINTIQEKIARFALQSVPELLASYSCDWASDTGLSNRNLDLWEPLLAIAKVIDDHCISGETTILKVVTEMATEISELAKTADDSPIAKLAQLLLDGISLKKIIPYKADTDFYKRGDVFEYLRKQPEIDWCTSLNSLTRYLANHLRILVKKVSVDGKNERCYIIAESRIRELIERYDGDSE
jgi:hypothetical protein